MIHKLTGIGASEGIAIAKAYLLEEPVLKIEKIGAADKEAEVKRFEEAINRAKSELEQIKEHANRKLGADKAEIFAAHLLVLADPELIQPVKVKICDEGINAEAALKEIADMFVSMFESMDNEYMRERAADIRDVTKRVMAHLLGVQIPNPSMISEEMIIIAKDLTPSDTAQLNRQYVKGFVTDMGAVHRTPPLWPVPWKSRRSSVQKQHWLKSKMVH